MPNDLLLLFRFGGLFLGSGLATLVVGRDATQQRSRGTTFWLVFAGTVSWCINVFFFEALKHAPPGVATAIVYVYPLLGAVGAACFLGEPLPVHAAFTGPAALFGLVVCVLGWPPGSGTTEGGVEPVGVLWSLLIAWSVSCFVLCQRVLSGRGDNPGALTGVRLNATLGLFVLSPLYVAVALGTGRDPPPFLLDALPPRPRRLAAALLFCHVAVSFAMNQQVLAKTVERALGRGDLDGARWTALTAALTALSLVIALALPVFSDLVSLIGALTSGPLTFAIPAICYRLATRDGSHAAGVAFLVAATAALVCLGTAGALGEIADHGEKRAARGGARGFFCDDLR